MAQAWIANRRLALFHLRAIASIPGQSCETCFCAGHSPITSTGKDLSSARDCKHECRSFASMGTYGPFLQSCLSHMLRIVAATCEVIRTIVHSTTRIPESKRPTLIALSIVWVVSAVYIFGFIDRGWIPHDATVDAAGKLNILGSFDRLYAREAPISHPQCALAIRLRFQRVEDGPKRFRIAFVDPDGVLFVHSRLGTCALRNCNSFRSPSNRCGGNNVGSCVERAELFRWDAVLVQPLLRRNRHFRSYSTHRDAIQQVAVYGRPMRWALVARESFRHILHCGCVSILFLPRTGSIQ